MRAYIGSVADWSNGDTGRPPFRQTGVESGVVAATLQACLIRRGRSTPDGAELAGQAGLHLAPRPGAATPMKNKSLLLLILGLLIPVSRADAVERALSLRYFADDLPLPPALGHRRLLSAEPPSGESQRAKDKSVR